MASLLWRISIALAATRCILERIAPPFLGAERQNGARAAMSIPTRELYDTQLKEGVKGVYCKQSTGRLIANFTIPKLMHSPLTVWTYNCQRMSATHNKDWDEMLGKRNDIWLMQGTQETYSPSRGENPLQRSSTNNYDIWESKALRRRGQKGQFFSPPEGVAVWAVQRGRHSQAAPASDGATLLFCSSCGAFSTLRVHHLAAPCRGRPRVRWRVRRPGR